ncbi:hypothetical protein CC99x_000980 [Candidatus Berkiella cookevillensis]|uniref:OTU domain-containing protein n=1 Tax=Candidatus Berkiella cookevillensis TaxID=437022 RepID=A0A0Q9YSH4_9GAMM|nr:hypothetical protein [Candidatus Berkiella cookevillensis]MCS5707469.1 hypothetical protein [Candidatus Berkiella cookevillensis]
MPLLKNTGDGTCLFHTISVSLYEALFNDTLALDEKKEGFDAFLQHFASFHPNFKPTTIENLKRWLNQYCNSVRDIELLISPVLRVWYEHTHNGIALKDALEQLPMRRHICETSTALTWLCDQFGFNLDLETDHGVEDHYDILGPQPGPRLTIKHSNNNHFDAHVSHEFMQHFKHRKDSIILTHYNGKVDGAYTHRHNPLPAVEHTIEEIAQAAIAPRDFYRELKHMQRALQQKAMQLEPAEQDRNKAIYEFNLVEDAHIPDQATLVLMYDLLLEEAKILEHAEQVVEAKQHSLRNI